MSIHFNIFLTVIFFYKDSYWFVQDENGNIMVQNQIVYDLIKCILVHG